MLPKVLPVVATSHSASGGSPTHQSRASHTSDPPGNSVALARATKNRLSIVQRPTLAWHVATQLLSDFIGGLTNQCAER